MFAIPACTRNYRVSIDRETAEGRRISKAQYKEDKLSDQLQVSRTTMLHKEHLTQGAYSMREFIPVCDAFGVLVYI